MTAAAAWTWAMIYALGVRTDLVTACSIVYGCGRTKAYEMLAAGKLDFPVLRAGNRVVVPMAPVLELLGIPPPEHEAAAPPGTAAEVRPTDQMDTRPDLTIADDDRARQQPAGGDAA